MAFLNGFIEEEIYMDQPEGFTTVGEEQKVCRLQRNDVKMFGDIKAWLSTQFSMKDMGEAPTSLASRSTGIDPEGFRANPILVY
ncbi:UNVERIFIED_CONTAM: hypothetical protein Sradi_7094600 [Sesamum radiatum]|uniref:Uncharacterized protein n=1 Tax=Sesamum radiatum TaxID=300843 RepID=A0AAW2J1W5_SESRA